VNAGVAVADILRAHALRYDGPLSVGSGAAVHRVVDEEGRPWVLKCYGAKPGVQQRELDFYESASRQRYEHLLVPRLLQAGEGYAITAFVEREAHTLDSIVERTWTAADVDLWVRALLEFQETPMRRRHFPISKQVLGLAYPIFRMGALLRRLGPRMGAAARDRARGMMTSYAALRPRIRSVLVHYDLQTSNYTFAVGTRRMSILDFEFSYYKGDPLFDLAYYCTIPVVELGDWDFQRRLIARYVTLARARAGYLVGWERRLRLILLVCALTRYVHFIGDAARQEAYWRSAELVLSDEAYRAFVDDVRALVDEGPAGGEPAPLRERNEMAA